mgnify:FL=1
MFKYFINIIFITIIFNNNTLFKFLSHNTKFIKSYPKIISFKYVNNIEGLSKSGYGEIIIGKKQYKVNLKNQIIKVSDNKLQRYNVNTNQIFIENTNHKFDSLIFNSFNKDFDTLIKNNLLNEKFELEITPSLDSTSIIEINVEYENYNFTLYDLNFIYENIDTTEVFSFNFPDAFIFDLRD